MRDRRSENSHDARSITASASREVTISNSIASSSTKDNAAPAARANSLLRMEDMVPPSEWRNEVTTPRCHSWALLVSSCSVSRRRMTTACSAGLSSSARAVSIVPCTKPTKPLTSSSV